MEKLDIRYSLIKEDGSFGDHENINSDWTEVWFIDYCDFQAIVDSHGRLIELGSCCADVDQLRSDWETIEERDVDLKLYPHFLNRLVDFVGDVDRRLEIDQPKQDPTCKTLDLLIANDLILNDPIEVGRKMNVDPAYLDSVQESLMEAELPTDRATIIADLRYHFDFLDEDELGKLLAYTEKLVRG